MRHLKLLTICALLLGCSTLASQANAAKVRVGKLVLRADGGFQPHVLPRRTRVPISFQGHADIETTDGSMPPALQRIRLDFDRDGLLTTDGLPVCEPGSIEGTGPKQARRICGGALVGTGHVDAAIGLAGIRVGVRSPLSLFNGPKGSGVATVIAHAQTSVPVVQTYVVVIPVERRGGAYSYRSTFDLPEIAGGLGALTHVDARIGRRYRAGGAERSYVSARCSDGILETLGYASFADGTVISGNIFKPCRPLP